MKWLRKFAANDIPNNVSFSFREKRYFLFSQLLKQKDKTGIILDIGGTNYFWKQWRFLIDTDVNLILMNLEKSAIKGYTGLKGDANNLLFIKEKSVEVILSNSVIEHLGGYEKQEIFAKEVTRIGKYYFVQTPAFMFPLEPHFLFPFFHWLPKKIRIFLHRNFQLGWFGKETDYEIAKMDVENIRILKKRELKCFFPNGKIITERFLFFPKSYIITNM